MSAAQVKSIQDQAQEVVKEIQDEFKKASPKGLGIVGGISLGLCLVYSYISSGKDERVVTFGIIFAALILGAIAVGIRVKSAANQYPWTVVVMTIASLFITLSPSKVLALSFVPAVINKIRAELKAD